MVEQAKAKTIYTTHEVSRLLQVNPRSVINWIEQSLLPSYRTPGGHRRIRRDDLLGFLRKHQIPTPAALVEGTVSVLIVDDEPEVSGMLKTFFERQGDYEISTATDGITALMEVGRLKPDLLILDIMLPGKFAAGSKRPPQTRRRSSRSAVWILTKTRYFRPEPTPSS